MPPKTSAYPRAKNDTYFSPPGVVAPLLRAVFVEAGIVWEPSAGAGALVDQLHDAGHEVLASDLVDHGRPDIEPRIDFLLEQRMPLGVSGLVTNPPFSLADKFVRHALRLRVPLVAMLLPVKFIAASGPRWELTRQVSDVVLLGRLKMRPPGTADQKKNPMVDFAWVVFRPGEPQVAQRWHNSKVKS